MQNSLYSKTVSAFIERFGAEPEIVAFAPGRVEVLGNHTDYNEGFVLSAAIDAGIVFAVSPCAGTTATLRAGNLESEVTFDVKNPESAAKETWANYSKGVVAGILRGKAEHAFNALFMGDIPQGAGLSSSAALEVSTGIAIAALYGFSFDRLEMAKIGQRSEHEFVGVKCGLLDQISSLYGADGALVKTDFRTFDVENVKLPPNAVLILAKTNAKHALVDGAYNERREDCEAARDFFKAKLEHEVTALRDVSFAEWEALKDGMATRVANRAAHPIGEDERVISGSECLARGDLAAFGALMFDSHESSRTLFENSCEELDTLVSAARKIDGVYGARLSGGGFGGSVVALADGAKAQEVCAAFEEVYLREYGEKCAVSVISPSAGARRVK